MRFQKCMVCLGVVEDLLSEIRLPWFKQFSLHMGRCMSRVFLSCRERPTLDWPYLLLWLEGGQCELRRDVVEFLESLVAIIVVVGPSSPHPPTLVTASPSPPNPLFYPNENSQVSDHLALRHLNSSFQRFSQGSSSVVSPAIIILGWVVFLDVEFGFRLVVDEKQYDALGATA